MDRTAQGALTRPFAPLLLGAALLSSSGCGTVFAKRDGQWGEPYAGARCSAAYTASSFQYDSPAPSYVAPLLTLDVALSAVSDTLLLPVDWAMRPPDPFRPTTVCPPPRGAARARAADEAGAPAK